MSTDNEIEREIQAKGLTAARVTPESIAAKITGEYYFSGGDGLRGLAWTEDRDPNEIDYPISVGLLTFCVLVLENGFTVTGQSAVASPENFNQEIGRKVARADAVNKIWPLEGYLLREQLDYEARRAEVEGL